VAISANERMDHVFTDPSRAVEASQPSTTVRRGYDDRFDFPPAADPSRELFTASLFVLMITTFVVWGGWRLISLMLIWLV
jgi:hypothetical protein